MAHANITPKPTIDFNEYYPVHALMTNGDIIEAGLSMLQQHCHAASYNRGWWHDPVTGLSLIPGDRVTTSEYAGAMLGSMIENMREAWFPYVIATKIALCHSETSEGLEAYRVDATDDKIPLFPGIVAEGGDSLIRWFDLIGCLQQYEAYRTRGEVPAVLEAYSLARAIMAKLPVNVGRADHDLAKRRLPGGKKF